jgi:hypothetical protein
MAGLNFFPKGQDQTAALKELRLALETARTVAVAEAAVSAIIAYSADAPKPAQLRRAVFEINDQLESRIAPAQCAADPVKRRFTSS